ncbi:hypothetical protein [Pedobacter nyackensis]|uniref:Alpha-L-fucosidase n=1 Tax=Pedobacter nyackensis TaxID=475255 RepID=A0A1W2A8S8_9SPHI|nr:hypothetical protein [Pedobacter nyackensis]SMC57067.1 alpha-L-fucosidase [Pedobacter nyackensis]
MERPENSRKHIFYIALAMSLFLMTISSNNFAQTYQPEWQSLDKRAYKCPL